MGPKCDFRNLISTPLGARGRNMIFYRKEVKPSFRKYMVCRVRVSNFLHYRRWTFYDANSLEQMDLYTTFRMRRSRGETYIGRGLLCVCVSVCLSLAAFSYCCTDPAVSWGMHGSCALLGEFSIGALVSLLRVRCGLSSNIKHYRTLLLLLTVTLSL